jgi:2-phosphosulfolactate phosphatase
MKFIRLSLDTCDQARGWVVVIDVLRAFSTAAYAFAAGAEQIILVSQVAEAFSLRKSMPGSLIMGEVDGLPVPGFDFSNSPAQFDSLDLAGRTLIQRTTSGTQGVIRSQHAQRLLAASFVNAAATTSFITQYSPHSVTFVITGLRPGGWGDEDQACADYLQAQLENKPVDLPDLMRRVRQSPPGLQFSDPNQPDFSPADLEYCLQVDQFDFALSIQRVSSHLVMRAVHPPFV